MKKANARNRTSAPKAKPATERTESVRKMDTGWGFEDSGGKWHGGFPSRNAARDARHEAMAADGRKSMEVQPVTNGYPGTTSLEEEDAPTTGSFSSGSEVGNMQQVEKASPAEESFKTEAPAATILPATQNSPSPADETAVDSSPVPSSVNPVSEDRIMKVTFKKLRKNKTGETLYAQEGAAVSVRFPKSMFAEGKEAPDTITIEAADGVLAGPGSTRGVKVTSEEQAAKIKLAAEKAKAAADKAAKRAEKAAAKLAAISPAVAVAPEGQSQSA